MIIKTIWHNYKKSKKKKEEEEKKRMYLQHCMMFDPNQYNKLMGINKHFSEEEENDRINRGADYLRWKADGKRTII